jgi:hypothetical protein
MPRSYGLKKRFRPPDDYDAPLSVGETIGAVIGAIAAVALVLAAVIALTP